MKSKTLSTHRPIRMHIKSPFGSMESKFDESKFDRLSDLEEKREIVVADTSLMENLISYCSSSSFTSAIEDFKRDHAYAFMSLAEEKSDGCHSLELTSIFDKYQTIIENHTKGNHGNS